MNTNRAWIFLFLWLFIKTNAETYCQYLAAEVLYPNKLFRSLSGYGCYSLSQPGWLKTGKHINPVLQNINYSDGKTYVMPLVNNGAGDIILFDYTSEKNLKYIEDLYISREFFQRKWLLCALNADDCCTNYLNEENSYPTPEYPCRAFWDGFSCYPRAKANTTVSVPCPSYTSTSDISVCNLYSERECLDNKWASKTNYGKCASAPIYRKRHNFHVAVLSTAIALMIPAVVIYFSFAELRNKKTLVFHRNLIVAILIKNILVIISKEVVILDAVRTASNGVMQSNGFGCKMLAFIESASKNAIFTCMSVDAFYLHKILVRPFAKDISMYIIYGVTAVASLTPTTIWAILMSTNNKGNCWMADSDSWYQWISDGYKYAMLGINVLLLIDICRVLCQKIVRSDNSNSKQNSAALRATLVLLPLFGVPLLITAQRGIVDMSDCSAGDIYTYTTYSIEALQGILLCILFCYLNSDVHEQIKKVLKKSRIHLSERYIWIKPPSDRRRTTAMTVIGQT